MFCANAAADRTAKDRVSSDFVRLKFIVMIICPIRAYARRLPISNNPAPLALRGVFPKKGQTEGVKHTLILGTCKLFFCRIYPTMCLRIKMSNLSADEKTFICEIF